MYHGEHKPVKYYFSPKISSIFPLKFALDKGREHHGSIQIDRAMNTLHENTGKSGSSKERRIYASRIRELREKLHLSQRSLAEELNLKRGAVAQWEGGAREPMQRNYLALAKFATRRNQPQLAAFFDSEGWARKDEGLLKAKESWRTKRAEEYFVVIKSQAAMGDREAKRLIRLSERGPAAYKKYLLKQINKEILEVKGWNFSDMLAEFSDEARNVEYLRRARESFLKKSQLGAHGDASE